MANLTKIVRSGTTYDIYDANAVHTVDASLDSSSTNPVQNKAIYTALNGKEDTTNKVTTLTSASTNTQYPSAKCVYDETAALEAALDDKLDDTYATSSASTFAGTAAVANKIGTTTVGSTTTPVYINNGVPTVCSATAAAASGGTAVTLVTTGEKYIWNNNTDTKVTQNLITANGGTSFYPILAAAGTGQAATTTGESNFTTSASLSDTGDIYAHEFHGRGSQPNIFVGTCSTAAATTAKVVTCSTFTASDLVVGAIVYVTFSYTNSGAVGSITMNVNSTGAKNIKCFRNGGVSNLPAVGYLRANETYMFWYDGTYWVSIVDYDSNTYHSYDYSGRYLATGAGQLGRYMMACTDLDGNLVPFNNTDNATTTYTKSMNSTPFDPFGEVYYVGKNSATAANGVVGSGTTYTATSFDCRYSLNINSSGTAGTTALSSYIPVYLKLLYNVSTKLATFVQNLGSSNYLERSSIVQALPTADPSSGLNTAENFYIYKLIGVPYSKYQMSLTAMKPCYYWNPETCQMEQFTGEGNWDSSNVSVFNMRQTPVGSRSVKFPTIVGGTVAWNQIVQNNGTTGTSYDVTYTNNGDGSWTISGTANGGTAYKALSSRRLEAHVYLYDYDGFISVNGQYRIGNFNNGASISTTSSCVIVKHTSASTLSLGVQVYAGYSVNVTIKPQVFDLTQMFGSTIADYIYLLEAGTAGAGVAVFRKLFPKPYYPYNAGELMSVKPSAMESVGFNQWDEEWEVGGLAAATGELWNTNTRIRSKNYIPVVENTSYYYKAPYTINVIAYYNADKSFISSINTVYGNAIYTTPDNCAFVKFAMEPNYGTTYNGDICINISDSKRNGTYESYKCNTYALDSSLELRGIMKQDANFNRYYDGDTYESDGTVTRKYGIVDLGTLTWSTGDVTNRFRATVSGIQAPSSTDERQTGIICSHYVASSAVSLTAMTDKGMLRYGGEVFIQDSSYSDAATFKTAMSGVYLVYELATPTTETAAKFVSPQSATRGGTEAFIDTRTVAIPVGQKASYTSEEYGFGKSLEEGLLVTKGDINSLTDTEEGTCTLTNSTLSSHTIACTYYRIGKQVTITGKLTKPSTATTGYTFTGLPFASATTQYFPITFYDTNGSMTIAQLMVSGSSLYASGHCAGGSSGNGTYVYSGPLAYWINSIGTYGAPFTITYICT